MYRYLVTSKNFEPFLTNYFEFEDHFVVEINMIVYDLIHRKYTIDGTTWLNIDIDTL
jgi:hypothetical protein